MERLYTLIISVSFTLGMFGQVPRNTHLFEFANEPSPTTLKFMIEQVKGLDTGALISTDGRQLKIGVRTNVTAEQLHAVLANVGLSEFRTNDVRTKELAGGGCSGMVPFPVYHDTGAPESDEEAYRTAKTAWIAAHPEWNQGAQTLMHR